MNYMTQHHHTLREEPFAGLHGLTVLLVEPESEARAFYSSQLSNIAMRVVAADTLQALQSHASTHNPDVVIVNPSEDIKKGITILKAFRQEHPELPIITMTMTMPDDTLDAMMQAGVSLHINRGLTRPRDLLLALEQVIALK